MTRRLITAFVRIVAKVFFRRIEIVGWEHVPPGAPVIFAVNHPNALIDPMFLLCFAPRPVSFLGKAPLLKMPLIGWFARRFDTIPVYRKQDNLGTSNRGTFDRARDVLKGGGSIAIFPEGTTHSDPRLRELKTGAARIALGAGISVLIVPTGLYYTEKKTFRSSALMYFGPPIAVTPEAVNEEGEPPAESVDALTAQIERALADVTLQADSHSALELIARAERIFTGGDDRGLAYELEVRRRFVAGYTYLRAHDPGRLARLESQVARVDAQAIASHRGLAPRTAAMLLLLPLAAVGAAIHYPLYRLIGLLATRFTRGEDEIIATVKAVGGMVFYPLMWIALAIWAGVRGGVEWALVVMVALPLLAYLAMRVFEALDDVIGYLQGAAHRDLDPRRRALRDEFITIAEEMGGGEVVSG
jgi:glycerol-3-phosphate O-acyltransferase / dihydroxyacetone phosphate acyltransferase